MYKFLLDLKARQNKEEVNKRQAKKRTEGQNRTLDAETPTKVKRVELEIENKEEKSDNNAIGKLFLYVEIYHYFIRLFG